MKAEVSIFWFRRDLRLHDNTGLYAALQGDVPVLPVFIFDTEILNTLPENDARVSFIHNTLRDLRKKLRKAGSSIALYHGLPLEVFKKITKTYAVKAVYTNTDYEPYARKRDASVKAFLETEGIPFFTYKDQVIFEKDEVVKKDGTPYTLYTPYSKKWLEKLENTPIAPRKSENLLQNLIKDPGLPHLSLQETGFTPSGIQVPDYKLDQELITRYEAQRDEPALDATSRLGPHLRFGTVSIRAVVTPAQAHENLSFLKELIWREFFMQILWHFPHTVTRSFKPAYDRIQWRNNEPEFEKWRRGETGYPLVDAGMRQLSQTGFMHNRIRMLTGSFLCKHLLIDWRWGEAYFAEKLLDYEMANNVGNWQWIAGCGTDAAPYFRVFNPATQLEKFDKDHKYVRTWIKEYHTPSYPEKIVEHTMARARCLTAYKAALR